MFDIKCINCKFFNPYESECKIGKEEETCKDFQFLEKEKEENYSCDDCAFFDNGFCAYDLLDPKTCRRRKDKEDL